MRVRVGISYTSASAARRNLDREIRPHDGVEDIAADARREWARQLRAVEVSGGTDARRTTFYTALYHAFLQPNVTSDVDGTYLGSDRRVHRLERGQRAQYGNFSGWDQYRAHTQLLALLEPGIASEVYRTGPNGLPGNDDLGTMSAWYVFAALGVYPQTPSRAELLLSSPMSPKARINRDGAPTITVSAPGASPSNVYVHGVTLDGRAHGKSWLSERFVTHGGDLVVDVAATPDTSWGTTDLPVDHVPPAKPFALGGTAP
ncbi:glycoside hydrolase domain-containing protein [Saccharothrix deserti]|uniref:glycoside hydrolase domain-containing protein n=1 Tax=Saccharothrix deserti TaxID=2593674 RepID=UPI00131A882F|nr:glycoside hydrolase domain-containing protein [Saccharothrix deserti]